MRAKRKAHTGKASEPSPTRLDLARRLTFPEFRSFSFPFEEKVKGQFVFKLQSHPNQKSVTINIVRLT